jgi:hypothetical protein
MGGIPWDTWDTAVINDLLKHYNKLRRGAVDPSPYNPIDTY